MTVGRIPAGPAAGLAPGEVRIVRHRQLSFGVFAVEDGFTALLNRCPHRGGPLCEGPVTGTTEHVTDRSYVYGKVGKIVRCAWHGWEFDIQTGVCLADPKYRARSLEVVCEGGELFILLKGA